MIYTTRRRLLLALPVAAGVTASACSGSSTTQQATQASTTPPSPSPVKSSPATTSPTPPQDLEAQEMQAQEDLAASQAQWTSDSSAQEPAPGSELVVSAVRTGQHPGFDRVVVDLSGPGAPGWEAGWAQEASTQGKGEPITPGGENLLVLRGTGVTMPVMPEQQQVAYQGQPTLPVGGKGLESAYIDSTFEGQYQLVLGTHSRNYRVFTLEEPTRLVVDVAHP